MNNFFLIGKNCFGDKKRKGELHVYRLQTVVQEIKNEAEPKRITTHHRAQEPRAIVRSKV